MVRENLKVLMEYHPFHESIKKKILEEEYNFLYNPLIDGFLTDNNSEKVNSTVSLLVSKIGNGRAVMFADNPNFRGSWYGTNRLFLNAILLGDKIRVP